MGPQQSARSPESHDHLQQYLPKKPQISFGSKQSDENDSDDQSESYEQEEQYDVQEIDPNYLSVLSDLKVEL